VYEEYNGISFLINIELSENQETDCHIRERSGDLMYIYKYIKLKKIILCIPSITNLHNVRLSSQMVRGYLFLRFDARQVLYLAPKSFDHNKLSVTECCGNGNIISEYK
jgi:hypothetical protein